LFLALILCHNVTPVYSDPDPADNQNDPQGDGVN